MSSKIQNAIHLILLTILLASCSPANTPPSPTSIPSQPTSAEAAPTENAESLFESGRRYSDSSGDMTVSFLDVVAFQATVHEETETVDVLLQMRDIPETADLAQVTNLIEYSWTTFVYLDSSGVNPADVEANYYLGLNTSVEDTISSGNSRTPVPGEPEQVPFYQLFQNRSVYDSAGRPVETVQVEINPDRNTLLFTGRVPGITSRAVFDFNTTYNESSTDRRDNYVPTQTSGLSTPGFQLPLPAIDQTNQLVPAGPVRAFPGPEHYAGDVLTFEIQTASSFDETFTVSMALDNREPTGVTATLTPYGDVLLPMAFDTTSLTGQHMLSFSTSDGDLHEVYSFEVLPAEQRPKNEQNAQWLAYETDCCTFHYVSNTAAARDIEFISEHFQQGAKEFESIMQAEIQSKMDVYLIDRLVGNGGFGGNGKLIISYTDRYYGPTVGGVGLETLARHEFSHAADISLEGATDGVDFNYEGLAVYVAGGHYKPEPLAQRGAAMFDLGYSAPVHEYIQQHELSYLHAAVILTYIQETYGQEKLWEFLKADTTADGQLLPMQEAIPLTFGISLEEFNQGFQTWLERNDPGEQLDDLRLTIELQDLRREYQDTYSPPPRFFLLEMVDAVARPENLPTLMREAHTPANIAVELIIADAQNAIVAAAYPEAQHLIQTLKQILSSGKFDDPLAKDYLDIALVVADEGYEVMALTLQNGVATVQVSREPPITSILELQKVDGIWQING